MVRFPIDAAASAAKMAAVEMEAILSSDTTQNDDLLLGQLLCSKLCHDLISPSGAVNAGLEMMVESPGDADALSLVQRSGAELGARLSFFRLAFGLGAGLDGTAAVDQIKALTENAFNSARLSVRWDGIDIGGREISGAELKLLLMALLIAFDSLPRGGTVTTTFAEVDGGLGIAVKADGQGAKLRDGTRDALADAARNLSKITARTVHVAFAARLSERFDIPFEVDEGGVDSVQLALLARGRPG